MEGGRRGTKGKIERGRREKEEGKEREEIKRGEGKKEMEERKERRVWRSLLSLFSSQWE